MELTNDWRTFQAVFDQPMRTARQLESQDNPEQTPLYVVLDQETVVAAYTENEGGSNCVGLSFREVMHQNSHRKVIAFDRAHVDQLLTESLPLPNYYDQVEFFRSGCRPSGALPEMNRHFLIEGIQGWWAKVLPSAYGVFIRVAEPEKRPQDLLLIVRRGAFESFFEPDLSSLGPDRRKEPAAVVKYLSEKYVVPVQGIFASSQEWSEWSRSRNPWREVAQSIRKSRAKLVPFRWSLAALTTTRGFFGV